MSKLKNTKEMKYVWLTIKFNYFVLPASVGVSYIATQFHVSNSDGRMYKGVKTSQRCEWLIVTSSNVSSKNNVKPSKVQITISFLIIWIFWSNINEFTLHIVTCLKNYRISKWPNLTRWHNFPWRGSYDYTKDFKIDIWFFFQGRSCTISDNYIDLSDDCTCSSSGKNE